MELSNPHKTATTSTSTANTTAENQDAGYKRLVSKSWKKYIDTTSHFDIQLRRLRKLINDLSEQECSFDEWYQLQQNQMADQAGVQRPEEVKKSSTFSKVMNGMKRNRSKEKKEMNDYLKTLEALGEEDDNERSIYRGGGGGS